jgi:hypothetical protein
MQFCNLIFLQTKKALILKNNSGVERNACGGEVEVEVEVYF